MSDWVYETIAETKHFQLLSSRYCDEYPDFTIIYENDTIGEIQFQFEENDNGWWIKYSDFTFKIFDIYYSFTGEKLLEIVELMKALKIYFDSSKYNL